MCFGQSMPCFGLRTHCSREPHRGVPCLSDGRIRQLGAESHGFSFASGIGRPCPDECTALSTGSHANSAIAVRRPTFFGYKLQLVHKHQFLHKTCKTTKDVLQEAFNMLEMLSALFAHAKKVENRSRWTSQKCPVPANPNRATHTYLLIFELLCQRKNTARLRNII